VGMSLVPRKSVKIANQFVLQCPTRTVAVSDYTALGDSNEHRTVQVHAQ